MEVLIRQGTIEDVIYLSYTASQDKTNRMYKNYLLSLHDTNTLLHSFVYKEEFRKNFSVLELEGSNIPIACASFYPQGDYSILLSRSYVVSNYRNNWYLTELLDYQLKHCIQSKLRVCFNYPTASFYEYIRRKSKGYLPSVWYRFKPIGKQIINNTEQYIIEYDRTTATKL